MKGTFDPGLGEGFEVDEVEKTLARNVAVLKVSEDHYALG